MRRRSPPPCAPPRRCPPRRNRNQERSGRNAGVPAGWPGCVSLPVAQCAKMSLVTKRRLLSVLRYQVNVATTPRWQRDAANPAGEDASVPFLRLRRARKRTAFPGRASVDACTGSECPTSTPSLCRRVKPVLLIAALFICSASFAKPRGVTLDVKDADVHVV